MRLLPYSLVFLALAGFGLSSCKDDEPNPEITFRATLNGASEVPANSSTATGNATLIYNDDTNIFNLTVTYTGMTPNNGHIHKGAVGVSGGVVFPFTSLASPITLTSAALTTEQETDLKAGLYYVNLHSTTYPGGEIRGQLIQE